jgi:hypothetical protein
LARRTSAPCPFRHTGCTSAKFIASQTRGTSIVHPVKKHPLPSDRFVDFPFRFVYSEDSRSPASARLCVHLAQTMRVRPQGHHGGSIGGRRTGLYEHPGRHSPHQSFSGQGANPE